MKTKTIFFNYKGKRIALNLSEPKSEDYKRFPSAIWAECKEAGFNQIRDKSDIADLIDILPEYIDEKNRERKGTYIHIRVREDEKVKIGRIAREKGFESVSKYIRSKALTD